MSRLLLKDWAIAAEHPQDGVGLPVGSGFGLQAHISQNHDPGVAVRSSRKPVDQRGLSGVHSQSFHVWCLQQLSGLF